MGIKGYHSNSLAGCVSNFRKLNSDFKTSTGFKGDVIFYPSKQKKLPLDLSSSVSIK